MSKENKCPSIGKSLVTIMLMVVALFVTGCEKEKDPVQIDELHINPEYVPIDWDDATLLTSNDSIGNYQIRFEGTIPDIHPGSVLAIDQDTVVHYIFVETVRVNGNIMNITSSEAFLTDIFYDTRFTLSTETAGKSKVSGSVFYPVKAYLIDENNGYQVLSLSGRKDDTRFTHNLWHYGFNHDGYVIHSGNAHTILMDKMNMDLDLDMEMYMNFGGRSVFETVADGIDRYRSEAMEVNAALIGKFNTEQMIRCKIWSICHISTPSITIMPNIFPPMHIKFMVGYVPIVLKLQSDLCCKAELDASGEIQAYTGFSDKAVGRMGFEWSQTGGMSPVSSFENTFAFTPPTIEGKGQIQSKLWAFPRISVMLYGVIGPSFDIMPYVKQIIRGGFREQLLGQTNDYCAWSYDKYVGLDLSCGLNLNFFGRRIINDVVGQSLPPWNVVDFHQYHSPKKIVHASGRPQGGQTATVRFNVYDYEYLFGTEVITPLPQIVKFEARGQLSSEYGIAVGGTASVDWTPSGDDVLYAKLYDTDGNVLAWDTVMVECDCNLTSGDWVDLGLPSGLLWATRNVGASSPEDYGDFFAWGETSPKGFYDIINYRYTDLYTLHLLKYTHSDGLTTLQPRDDAATANYGGRTPTKVEWEELINNTTYRWMMLNGVNGCCFTGPNGNSLFLPAAGHRLAYPYNDAGVRGYYWSSWLNTGDLERAWSFYFYPYSKYMYEHCYRYDGLSVRAVRSAQ